MYTLDTQRLLQIVIYITQWILWIVVGRSIEFAKSYEETGPGTPVFFILSPGVDPLKDVEALGKKIGFTFDALNFHNISLGQGQEVVAERAMDLAAKEGHWVVLQVGLLLLKCRCW